ncbi:MAG: GNAT family N-acetyltransferase [bacterium]
MSFEMIDDLTDAQIEELHALYQSEWWTKGRQLDDVRRMVQHTDIIIAFCDAGTKKLVAFTRILTDYAYKALVFDVIVAEPYRNSGLGRQLMDAVVHHSALKAVRHIELYCLPELAAFYQQWGFTTELGELRFMRRVNE